MGQLHRTVRLPRNRQRGISGIRVNNSDAHLLDPLESFSLCLLHAQHELFLAAGQTAGVSFAFERNTYDKARIGGTGELLFVIDDDLGGARQRTFGLDENIGEHFVFFAARANQNFSVYYKGD